MKKLIHEILTALYIRRVKRQIQRDLARAYGLTTKEIQVKILPRTPVKYKYLEIRPAEQKGDEGCCEET